VSAPRLDPHSTSTLAPQRDRPVGPVLAEATLRTVYPPGLELVIALGDSPVTLGRAPPDNTCVDHPTVSRAHLEITWRASDGVHVAADAKSRNGSWLDGARLRDPRTLRHGSVLRLGDVLLVYERGRLDDAPGVSRLAIPGASPAAHALRVAVARAARDAAPVLVVGETGSGKERIAEELHRLSGRSGPLVRMNCAALSRELVESQLFGHLRGAFTGAADAQAGFFRAAHGGSLFLDEVGELPPSVQPKLLRALEEGSVTPVGSSHAIPAEVRVVAATHRDLTAEVEVGTFRRDLFARLSMWEVRVPPLRARRSDLLDWIGTLHARFAASRGGPKAAPRFSPDAAELLLLHAWPTNLRGLDKLVRQLGADGLPEVIGAGDLPDEIRQVQDRPMDGGTAPRPAVPTADEFKAEFERLGGSVHALARHYQRDRRQIYRWIAAHELKGARDEP